MGDEIRTLKAWFKSLSKEEKRREGPAFNTRLRELERPNLVAEPECHYCSYHPCACRCWKLGLYHDLSRIWAIPVGLVFRAGGQWYAKDYVDRIRNLDDGRLVDLEDGWTWSWVENPWRLILRYVPLVPDSEVWVPHFDLEEMS